MIVSIITVSYNSAFTIRDTIESVLSQTYKNIEYIIIDGNSTDKTIEIVKEYEPKFKGHLKWISEPDKGLYDAMNKGINMVSGDVVGIINSDDLFCDNHAIAKVVDVFQLGSEIEGVYADLFYVSQIDTSKIIRTWKTGVQRPFSTGWHPAHPTLYIKKEVYFKHGVFDLDFKLAADFELMLRLLDKYKIVVKYLPEILVKMRLGGETNKSLNNIIRQNIECLRAFDKNEIKVSRMLYPFQRLLPKLLQYGK